MSLLTLAPVRLVEGILEAYAKEGKSLTPLDKLAFRSAANGLKRDLEAWTGPNVLREPEWDIQRALEILGNG